jgi:hypothetical protein
VQFFGFDAAEEKWPSKIARRQAGLAGFEENPSLLT